MSIFKSGYLILKGFFDAEWDKCLFIRKYVTGYLVFFGNSRVPLKNKRQETISRSFIEFEYMALGSLTCVIILVLKILFDLGFLYFMVSVFSVDNLFVF